MTIGDLPISMMGAKSFSVSNASLGCRLGLTAWVSNTRTNVVPSGGERAAACVPMEPEAPPRFSITTVAFKSCSSRGCTCRAI
jgi:hypothetical protein